MDVQEEEEEDDDVEEEDRSKTGKHTLCEPAQSKCRWTSREAFCLLIYKENGGRSSRGKHFVQACAVGMHMDMSQEACCGGIYLDIAGRF